jgi:chromosome segregation ATPase
MKPRLLPILNAIGCLALAGLVVAQWQKERALGQVLTRQNAELAENKSQAEKDRKRVAALERDIEVLKETIATTQKAADESAKALLEREQNAARIDAELKAAREQLTLWEAALKARDERIVSLDANLAATRKRLDEAVARLKAAGAR